MQDSQSTKKLDKLYTVEKIIGIGEKNGARYGKVKWQNYSRQENTDEPLEQLKQLVGFREIIEELQRKYDMKQMESKIKNQIKRGISAKLKRMYGIPDSTINQQEQDKHAHFREANPLSIYEQSKVDVEVTNEILRRAKLTLRDLTSQDYFYFMKLRFHVEQEVYRKMRIKSIPKTDEIIDKVTSFYRSQKTFKFCVTIKTIVYSCSIDEMLQLFPVNFLNYLNQITSYLKVYMAKQIEEMKQDKNRKGRLFLNLEARVSIKQRLQSRQNPIYFGINQQQAEKMRKRHVNQIQGIPADSDSDDDFASSRSRSGQDDPYGKLHKMHKVIKDQYSKKQAEIQNQTKPSKTPYKQKNQTRNTRSKNQLKNLQESSVEQSRNDSSENRRVTRQKRNIYEQEKSNDKKDKNQVYRKKISNKPICKETMEEQISSKRSSSSQFR